MQLSKSISFLISSPQQSLKDKAMILLSEVGTGAPTLFCMSPEPKAWPLAKAEPESECPPRHKEITYAPAAPSAWPHLLGPGASSGLLRVGGWQVPRRLLLQVRGGRTQVHPQVREGGLDELGRDGLSL